MHFRERLIQIVTFLGGIYFFLKFVLPETFLGVTLSDYNEVVTTAFRAVGAMAVGLELINILIIHGRRLRRKEPHYLNSIALLLGLAGMVVVTSLDWRAGAALTHKADQAVTLREYAAKDTAKLELLVPPYEQLIQEANLFAGKAALLPLTREELVSALSQKTVESPSTIGAHLSLLEPAYRAALTEQNRQETPAKLYKFLTEGFFNSLGSAMFSLLGFYIAAAAFRAFRIRSFEASLMMVAALIVMLGQTPFGLWISDALPSVRLWILTTPSAAARRAIEFGAAIAGLMLAFRMWLSIGERGGR